MRLTRITFSKSASACGPSRPTTRLATPMLYGLPQAAQDSLAASVPFPARLGQPAEYAALAVQIVENGYLNGETIRIDGALRMAPK